MIDKKLVAFLRKCHTAMDFDSLKYPFDPASAVSTLVACRDNGIFIEQREEGEVVGCFAAILAPDPYHYKYGTYHEVV